MIALILALCLGVNQFWINSTQLALDLLEPDCWYNWTNKPEENFQDERYSPMLWRVTNRILLDSGELAIKYPGRKWFVYNEPEGIDQANTSPELAAEWFDKTYNLIKNNDSSALVGCCGIMIRQSGMDWIEAFKPVNKPDFYHIHIYATNKKDWQTLVDYWHHWNRENIPTYITETCGVTSNNQADLLDYVAHYKHPNIKQIYWFSAFSQDGWNCNLLQDNKLTNLGNIFKQNLPLKITPTLEPPTPTATQTIIPTRTPIATLQPLPTNTPISIPTNTPTNTPTTTDNETTLIDPTTPEPDVIIIYVYQVFQPIIFK